MIAQLRSMASFTVTLCSTARCWVRSYCARCGAWRTSSFYATCRSATRARRGASPRSSWCVVGSNASVCVLRVLCVLCVVCECVCVSCNALVCAPCLLQPSQVCCILYTMRVSHRQYSVVRVSSALTSLAQVGALTCLLLVGLTTLRSLATAGLLH